MRSSRMSKRERRFALSGAKSSERTTPSIQAGTGTHSTTDVQTAVAILRYDNENETIGRHERYTRESVKVIEFPGIIGLRDQFLTEIEDL